MTTLSKARVLCTEDDEDTRELIRFTLRSEGYEVVTTENPAQALSLAQSEDFQLYIVDSWLPGVSGDELTRKIREFDSQTPILYYSGAALDADKESAFAAGAQAYLVKPAALTELVEEVSRLIAEANARPTSNTNFRYKHATCTA